MVDDYMASGNELYVRFVSSKDFKATGFKASYVTSKHANYDRLKAADLKQNRLLQPIANSGRAFWALILT